MSLACILVHDSKAKHDAEKKRKESRQRKLVNPRCEIKAHYDWQKTTDAINLETIRNRKLAHDSRNEFYERITDQIIR